MHNSWLYECWLYLRAGIIATRIANFVLLLIWRHWNDHERPRSAYVPVHWQQLFLDYCRVVWLGVFHISDFHSSWVTSMANSSESQRRSKKKFTFNHSAIREWTIRPWRTTWISGRWTSWDCKHWFEHSQWIRLTRCFSKFANHVLQLVSCLLWHTHDFLLHKILAREHLRELYHNECWYNIQLLDSGDYSVIQEYQRYHSTHVRCFYRGVPFNLLFWGQLCFVYASFLCFSSDWCLKYLHMLISLLYQAFSNENCRDFYGTL